MTQAERAALHHWTRHEYERLIDHGFLDEDDRIELLGAPSLHERAATLAVAGAGVRS